MSIFDSLFKRKSKFEKRYSMKSFEGKPFKLFKIEDLHRIKDIGTKSDMIQGNVVIFMSENLINLRHVCEQIVEAQENKDYGSVQSIIKDIKKML